MGSHSNLNSFEHISHSLYDFVQNEKTDKVISKLALLPACFIIIKVSLIFLRWRNDQQYNINLLRMFELLKKSLPRNQVHKFLLIKTKIPDDLVDEVIDFNKLNKEKLIKQIDDDHEKKRKIFFFIEDILKRTVRKPFIKISLSFLIRQYLAIKLQKHYKLNIDYAKTFAQKTLIQMKIKMISCFAKELYNLILAF